MRPPRHLAAALRLACAVLAACGGDGTGSSMAGPAGSDTGAPADDESLDAPVFTSTDATIVSSRTEPLVLGVRWIYQGLTALLQDGAPVGALVGDDPAGSLTTELLTLALDGGLVAGRSTLRLVTPGSSRSLYSQPLEVTVQPGPFPELRLESASTLGTDVEAARLVARGDDGAVLLLRDGAASLEAELLWLRQGTLVAGPRALLAGLVPPLATAFAFGIDDGVARVAWRVGLPGVRIDGVVLPPAGDGIPRPWIALGAPLHGPVESSALDGPLVAGSYVLARLDAHADVEQPRRGDTTVAGARVEADGTAGPPGRLLGAAAGDVDLLGFALRPAHDRIGAPQHTLSARIDGVRSALLDLELGTGAVRVLPSLHEPSAEVILPDAVALQTIAAGLGSTTTFLGLAGARAGLQTLDSDRAEPAKLLPIDTPLPPLSGAPAITLLAGTPLALLPCGPDEPLRALLSDGSATRVRELPDLACRDVLVGRPDATQSFATVVCVADDGTATRARLVAD